MLLLLEYRNGATIFFCHLTASFDVIYCFSNLHLSHNVCMYWEEICSFCRYASVIVVMLVCYTKRGSAY